MPAGMHPLKRFRKEEGGQALLEFALFSSLFVMILVGVTDLSLYLIAGMAVQEAATEGAAYGASPGNQAWRWLLPPTPKPSIPVLRVAPRYLP